MPTPDPNSSMENLTKVSTIGTNFAFSVVGMGIIGFAMDYFLKTSPKWLIASLAFGLLGGGYRFIRDALAANKQAAAQAARRKHAPYHNYSPAPVDGSGSMPIHTQPAPTHGHHPIHKSPHHPASHDADRTHPHHGPDSHDGNHGSGPDGGGDGGSGGDGGGGGGDGGGGGGGD